MWDTMSQNAGHLGDQQIYLKRINILTINIESMSYSSFSFNSAI